MNESYHFASVPQFRVGGVYRSGQPKCAQKQPVVHLVGQSECDGFAVADQWLGRWNLADGKWESSVGSRVQGCEWLDLIPGELHQVNGEWVPVEQSLQFPSGAVIKTSGDKIVGREEPAEVADAAGLFHGCAHIPEERKPCTRSGSRSAEPIRPALIWNTPTAFDPFAGYEVTAGRCGGDIYENASADHSHPLQRMNDGGPANASASLLLKTA